MNTINTYELSKMINREHRNVLRNVRSAMKSEYFQFTESCREVDGRKFIVYEMDFENAIMMVGEFNLDFTERRELIVKLKNHFEQN
ncbi:hypothetical protein [Aeromonas salmonicida]|uniref:hypothetical protein n=1 Tax=Aeromonas salmonicida TaxID=645 RepID=UPI003D30F064